MFASYEWFTGYLERLAQVTPEDVQRVAQSWLRRQKRILGIYRPDGTPMPEAEAEVDGDDLP